MKGSTHLAGGILAGLMLHNAMGGPTIYAGVAVAGLAALAPDWIQVNIPGANQVARGIMGHRGLSHWVLTALLIGMGVRFISPSLAAYAMAGWLSHIALDILSGGVPALWPWPGRITLANIKTGSNMDSLVGAAGLVLAFTIGAATLLRSLP